MLLPFFFAHLPMAQAQVHEPAEHCTLQSLFRRGHIGGHVRSFSMSTVNHGGRPDYWTSAMGAGLHFETGILKGFSAGLEGVFAFRLAGNDLSVIDSVSGKDSRFEQQLYDLEHPENFDDLDRLEELYLRYQGDGLEAMMGRMRVETPIVNPHDGRMKPKVFQGLQASWSPGSHRVYLSWITHASPRSTTHWYRLDDAIGIYNNGCLPNGDPASYRGRVRSRGMGILGFESRMHNWKFSYWNYWMENISGTGLIQVESDSLWVVGLQMLLQTSTGAGGLESEDVGFIRSERNTQVFSARFGRKFGPWQVTANGTYITDRGTWLFPREFGVDPFFTTLTRGWLEGLGSAHSVMLEVKRAWNGWEVRSGTQYIHLRGNPQDFSRNKYGMFSHIQHNVEIRHDFDEFLEGVKARLLYTIVTPVHPDEVPAERLHNLLDFHHLSLVLEMGF